VKTHHTIFPFCLLILFVFSLASYAEEPELPFTQWTGGSGNWHDSTKWTNGVPHGEEFAEVANGEVAFSTETHSHVLVIGQTGPVNEVAIVTGSADMVVNTILQVGTSSGTGKGTVERGTGKLTLSQADLRILGGTIFPDDTIDFAMGDLTIGTASGTGTNTSFTGIGEVNIADGDLIVPLGITVGSGGGTGTNTTMVGRGKLNLTGSNVTTQGFFIGESDGTGTSTGTGVGEVVVTSGNIILVDSPLDAIYDVDIPGTPKTHLWIGIAGGTGGFNGNATGTLNVFDGDVVADSVMIGRTSPISSSSGASQGSLFLEDGDLQMKEMVLGLSSSNGGPASGLFQQIRGTTTGDSLSVGPSSKIVLGISGPTAGVDYSQILVDSVALNGAFEARFVEGFLPAPGDVFNLMMADSITGSYSFQITGINTAEYPNLVITQSDQLVQLRFTVPEPCVLALLALGCVLSVIRRA
jgi:hypothetical protein